MSRHEHLLTPKIGLGCMNLSHAYGAPVAEADAVRALQKAFEMGYRHFDTATLYGAGANERLVGQALRGIREEVMLASKCGMANIHGNKQINGRPETLRRQCEESLKRLQTEHIDLYYLHRKDPDVPIEESVGALQDLVQEGKIGAIGLSEVSAETLHKAHKEAPITALQSEYSLWTRNPEIATLEATKALGVTFVAFSPLGRGFLSNTVSDPEALEDGDIRISMPRFTEAHWPQNQRLLQDYLATAKRLNATPAQLALSWLAHQSEHIVTIPGTRSVAHMQENFEAQHLVLSHDDLSELSELFAPTRISGPRYGEALQQEIDTETFDFE
ncbi:aldo/keto reductase [Marinomonas ostreistagni]|uniref:aldo/keto reductase n=1 Tax=Marinomonas ostreistagni TaxID=359209 RepID=UPI00194F7D33|nr:aldo/keto reductase [Marinomonas ostreistagni]MBM6549824.1 aldo/keto reductase [Marinomonas ostreistagni]